MNEFCLYRPQSGQTRPAGRWQTCIHLSGEGQVLLVDCGATSIRARLAETMEALFPGSSQVRRRGCRASTMRWIWLVPS